MSENKELTTVEGEDNLPVVIGYEKALEALTTMPDANPDVVHAFLDAQERIMDREAKMAFIKARQAVRRELPTIVKNKFNDQTKSTYADFEAIKKVVDPILDKNGLDDTYDYEYPEEGVTITICTLTHIQGHESHHRVRVTRDNVGIKGSVNKTDVHGDGSAATYGQRRSLGSALGIKTSKDDDGNKAGAVAITDKQRDKLQALIDETGADIQEFCQFLNVDSLAAISTLNYSGATSCLQAKKIKQLESKDDST